MAFALYQVDTDAGRLAQDTAVLRLMVRATRQAFQALRTFGTGEIPTNLTILYLRTPERFAVHYWRRVLASPRGELWFAAHSRAAVQEMSILADELQAAVHRTEHAAPISTPCCLVIERISGALPPLLSRVEEEAVTPSDEAQSWPGSIAGGIEPSPDRVQASAISPRATCCRPR